MAALTPKQMLFVREYLVDLNATQAALRAGYSAKTAGKIGFENLQKPEIAAAIAAAQTARAQRLEVTADRVLRELARLAFFDPRKLLNADGSPKALHELDDDTAAAIAGLEVFEEFAGAGQDRVQIGVVKKYKVADKNTALTNAMRHLGMLRDKVEHSGPDGKPLPAAAPVFNINMPSEGKGG
jgi:phage terminase small subunit